MRLSDAGLRQRRTKALDLNHRLPPCPTEDATRDRSNRLLEELTTCPRPAGSRGRSPSSAHLARLVYCRSVLGSIPSLSRTKTRARVERFVCVAQGGIRDCRHRIPHQL